MINGGIKYMKKGSSTLLIVFVFSIILSNVGFASTRKEYWVKNTYSPYNHYISNDINNWTMIPEDHVVSCDINNGMFKLVYNLDKQDSFVTGSKMKTVTVESSIENIIILTIEEE